MAEFILEEVQRTPTNPPGSSKKSTEEGQTRVDESVERWRSELVSYLGQMRKFEAMDPGEVFLQLSAYSARACEMRAQIAHSESRKWSSFRVKQIDPFLEACEFQFRVHSRVAAMRELEWKMSGGGA